MAASSAMASPLTQRAAMPSTPAVGRRVPLASSRGKLPSLAFSLGLSPQSCQQSVCAVRSAGEESATSREKEAAVVSRREATAGAAATALAAALLAVAPARPAQAKSVEDRYSDDTTAVIDKIRYTLNLDKSDPAKVEAVQSLKSASVDWVARYRREKKVAGKPSFSNMYSVLNAISGHYNSFGVGYPIPAKRRDRIFQEVDDAEKALAKGR